jgi:transposase
MRQKSGTPKVSPEQVLKDIRRATRKHYSTEDKIRIVLDGRMVCVANIASPSCAAAKGLAKACTTVGRRSSWKPASGGLPRMTARSAITEEVKELLPSKTDDCFIAAKPHNIAQR